MPMRTWTFAILAILNVPAFAAPLVLHPVPVSPRVYVVYGDLGNGSYENEGLNANVGFIVGNRSVMVVNTGPSNRYAEALHAAIRKVTDKPVRYAVNLNSQRYYWLGNGHFRKLGATLIAQTHAAELMRQDGAGQLESSRALLKEKAAGTELVVPNDLVIDRKVVNLGRLKVELRHFGNAHTPGDLAVWIPSLKTVFAGDIAFNERLLAVLPIGSTAGWLKAFDAVDRLGARMLIPGHGRLIEPRHAREDTRDYLAFLRTEAKRIFDAGGSLQDAVEKVDQSRFSRLANYELLAGRNMNIVFQEIERESF